MNWLVLKDFSWVSLELCALMLLAADGHQRRIFTDLLKLRVTDKVMYLIHIIEKKMLYIFFHAWQPRRVFITAQMLEKEDSINTPLIIKLT